MGIRSSGVRITDVRVHVLERDDIPLFRWRDGLPRHDGTRCDAWVQVCTDDGPDGWSPVEHWGRVTEAHLDQLRQLALGADPLRKELLWRRAWEHDRMVQFPLYVFGALDVACWDITAKVAGLPLFEVLGGYRASVPAYASTVTFSSVAEFLEVADQCLEAGFGAIKLHAWGDWRRDAHLAQELRAHVGDGVDLMYDGSGGFRYHEALPLGRALEEAGYLWYEEPMMEFAVEPHRRLAADLDIPILGAEVVDGAHYTAAEWLQSGACDLIRTSHHLCGGVTGAMRIAHIADGFATTAEVHGGGLLSLQLCAAIPNCTYYESLVAQNPVLVDPLVGPDGTATVPDTPGIGFEPQLAKTGLIQHS